MIYKSKKNKLIEILRDQWGKERNKYRNFELISIYHNIKREQGSSQYVDVKTWKSLEMDEVYSLLDSNISTSGQQYLYHMLKEYKYSPEQLQKYYSKYKLFLKDQKLRESFQLALMEMRNDYSYNMPQLIFDKTRKRIKYDYLLFLLSFISINAIFMIPIYNYFVIIALVLGLINIFINKKFDNEIYANFSEIAAMDNLFKAAIKISKIKTHVELSETIIIKQNIKIAYKLRKKIGRLYIKRANANELVVVIIEYLNQLFLYDLLVYILSFATINKYRKEICELFEAVACIDSIISIANTIGMKKEISSPEFSENIMGVESIIHPLIKNATPNSIEKISKSILISGSNMAGKTTFIKTIGINAILAQTIGVVYAKKMVLPFMDVYASIDYREDIEKGHSYYFAEVDLLLKYIKQVQNKRISMLLIDEIFRGTNTVERVSAACAVLKYLNKQNTIVMVTTHDIELEELLNERYKMFNFSEKMKFNNIYFDYKIEKGPCKSRNAIKLLEIKGYPQEIIEEANHLVQQLQDKKIEINSTT